MNRREKQIWDIAKAVARDLNNLHEQNFHTGSPDNTSPVPKVETRNRVKVLTFDRDGKQGSYQLPVGAKPDYTRIEQETIGKGMLAAIVIPCCKTAPYRSPNDALLVHSHEIFPIHEGRNEQGWKGEMLRGTPSHGWLIKTEKLDEWIVHIQKAISEWREQQPKPVWKPEAGKWAWCSYPPSKIVKVIEVRGNVCIVESLEGKLLGSINKIYLHPVEDNHWIVEIGGIGWFCGMKVTAHTTKDGKVYLRGYLPGSSNSQILNFHLSIKEQESLVREICAKFNIPIKPFDYFEEAGFLTGSPQDRVTGDESEISMFLSRICSRKSSERE